jgi:hypothetical protein
METYGVRASGVGSQPSCDADVRVRGSFDQVRCDDDEVGGIAMGHTQEPGLENGRRNAGRM